MGGPKRVWIVGAGFSRSLGAPLLNDLLSPAARLAIMARFSDLLPEAESDPVFWLYHYGTDFAEGTLEPIGLKRGVRRWRDAEQFLETLDEACDKPRVADELSTLWSRFREKCGINSLPARLPDLPALRKNAKRVVAASCAGFLEDFSKESVRDRERWQPYLNWLARLRENDTIISFNYDRVIELLAPIVPGKDRLTHTWGVRVAGMEGTLTETELADEARMAGLPTLLKLHGSVDWTVAEGNATRRDWNRELLAASNEPAIATPGPLKMTMAEGFFKRLWRLARDRLAEADTVYILGFRFPESDAHPRERLLSALHGNKNHDLEVHVVLGPDVHGRDSRRVLDLLDWTVAPARMVLESNARLTFRNEEWDAETENRRAVVAQAMYVEDFFTVWSNAAEIPPARGAAS